MASEKRASEGIALLSMYGDEDDEIMDDEEENNREEDVPHVAADAVTVEDNDAVSEYGNENTLWQQEDRGLIDNSTPSKSFNYGTSSASATPQVALFSPQQQQQQQLQQQVGLDLNSVQSQRNRLTIVDYGHEEGAISPEPEEGEIRAAGRVMYGEQLQTSDGESREKKSPGTTQATTPQSLEPIDQSESDAMYHAVNESESLETGDAVMVSIEEQKDVDPLDKFLPLPPKTRCSEELQEKIIKFLALKKTTGRSFNAEVRNRKEYRNPDFLLHAVTYQDIDQIGSCFSKDVFDPHGYDKSDFCDEIEADMRREMERREQERKKNQKLDFASGGIQPGNVVPTPKISMPTAGLTAIAGGLLNVTPATSDVTARDGRQNKKSKWMLIKRILWQVEDRKICRLSVLTQHLYLLLKLVVDTLLLRNKGEKKQKISDLVIRSWREDRRVVSLLVGLHIHISIATDMKMKEKSGHAETASLFSVFKKYNVYIIMIIYFYFSIRLIILAKCFLWTIDPLAC